MSANAGYDTEPTTQATCVKVEASIPIIEACFASGFQPNVFCIDGKPVLVPENGKLWAYIHPSESERYNMIAAAVNNGFLKVFKERSASRES